jgi:hypothetical protein
MMHRNLTEHDMRAAVLAFVAVIGLAMVALTAQAFSAGPGRIEAASDPHISGIAQGCSPGFHWVGKHRNRYGGWVAGHCAKTSDQTSRMTSDAFESYAPIPSSVRRSLMT